MWVCGCAGEQLYMRAGVPACRGACVEVCGSVGVRGVCGCLGVRECASVRACRCGCVCECVGVRACVCGGVRVRPR